MRRALRSVRSAARLLTAAGWTILVASIVLTVVGFVWSLAELLVVGIAFFGAVLVAVGWMLSQVSIQGRRTVEPAQVEEGVEANASLRITNLGQRRSPRLAALDHVNGVPAPVAIAPIEPGGTRTRTYLVPSDRRGIYELGPLTLAHTDPLRIVRAGSGLGGQAQYAVLPRFEIVPGLPTGRIRDLEGAATPRTAGSGVTFHTLREYVPGDDLRQIHWRSTARAGALLVRQNVVTSEPQMVIFIDCRKEAFGRDGFDDACRIAASLLHAARRGSNPVEVMASSGQRASVDSSGYGIDGAMELLARLTRRSEDPGIVQLARTTERRHGSSSVAVISGKIQGSHAELLLALQRRFASFTVIQVGDAESAIILPMLPSALVRAKDAADFARQWRERRPS